MTKNNQEHTFLGKAPSIDSDNFDLPDILSQFPITGIQDIIIIDNNKTDGFDPIETSSEHSSTDDTPYIVMMSDCENSYLKQINEVLSQFPSINDIPDEMDMGRENSPDDPLPMTLAAPSSNPPPPVRLQYSNGSNVPPNAIIRKEGRSYYARVNDEAEIQVYTPNVINKRRLLYPNGKPVPSDAKIRTDGKYSYALMDSGDLIPLITYNSFHKYRFLFPDGLPVPFHTEVFKHNRFYFAKVNGDIIQVRTANAFTTQRYNQKNKEKIREKIQEKKRLLHPSNSYTLFRDNTKTTIEKQESPPQVKRRIQ